MARFHRLLFCCVATAAAASVTRPAASSPHLLRLRGGAKPPALPKAVSAKPPAVPKTVTKLREKLSFAGAPPFVLACAVCMVVVQPQDLPNWHAKGPKKYLLPQQALFCGNAGHTVW